MAKRGGNNLNIVLGVDIAGLKKGFDDAVKVSQKAGGDVEKSAKAVSDSVQAAFKKIENSSSLKQASRQMFNLAASLQAGGSATSKTFQQAIREAGHLQDEIQDLNALIQVGGPAGPFIAMNNALKIGVAGMNAVQGSMALMGTESEALMQTMVKLQAGMALAGALKELEGVEDVWKQLNFTMKQNPALAVAAGITAVVAAIALFHDSSRKLSQAEQARLTVQTKAIDKYADEEAALIALQRKLNDSKITRSEQQKLIDDFNREHPNLLKGLNAEKLEHQGLNNAIVARIALIRKEAEMEAAKALYIEEYKRKLMAIQKQREETAKGPSFMDKALSSFGGVYGDILSNQFQIGLEIEDADKKAEAFYNTWQKIADEVKTTKEELKKLYNFDFSGSSSNVSPKSIGKPNNWDPAKARWFGSAQIGRPDKYFFNPLGGMAVPDDLPQDIEKSATALDKLAVSLAKVNVPMREFYSKSFDFSKQLTDITQRYAESAATFAAVSLGDIMAGAIMGTGGGIQQALTGLSNMLASYLAELGKQLIALSGVFATIQVSLRGLDPTGMLIAGLGLFAVSGLIKGITARANEKSGVRAFADGGVIFGPTLGLMGEYAGAAANPEIVAPLDRLKSLLQPSMGGFVAETRISGRDLQILLSKTERDYSRG